MSKQINPFVSVCVQTYNQYNYIEECLDGILMQKTTFPFEIILGEDESSDGTREICIEYFNKHPDKIKLFLRSRKDVIYINGNATGRFNFIENLKACSGKYIALCEGDDYWTDPLKLQKQVDFLENNEDYNICFHKVRIYNQSLNLFEEDKITRKVNETTTIKDLALGNYIHTPSVVLKNNFTIPNWFTKVSLGDWTLYMLAVKNKKIKLIDEKMAVYRIHGKSIWSNKTQKVRNKKTKETVSIVYNNLKNKINSETGHILKSRIGNHKRKSFFRRVFLKLIR